MFTFKSGYLLIFFIFSVKRFAPFRCLYSSRFNCFLLFSEKRHTSNSNRVKPLLNSLFHTVLFHKRDQIKAAKSTFRHFIELLITPDFYYVFAFLFLVQFCFEKHLVSSVFACEILCFVLKLYIWSVPYALCNPLRDGLWVLLSEDCHIERVAVFTWVLWRTTSPLHYPDVPAQKSFAVTMEAEVRKRKGEDEAAVTLINVWWPINCRWVF